LICRVWDGWGRGLESDGTRFGLESAVADCKKRPTNSGRGMSGCRMVVDDELESCCVGHNSLFHCCRRSSRPGHRPRIVIVTMARRTAGSPSNGAVRRGRGCGGGDGTGARAASRSAAGSVARRRGGGPGGRISRASRAGGRGVGFRNRRWSQRTNILSSGTKTNTNSRTICSGLSDLMGAVRPATASALAAEAPVLLRRSLPASSCRPARSSSGNSP
jgi:hypothetical protein